MVAPAGPGSSVLSGPSRGRSLAAPAGPPPSFRWARSTAAAASQGRLGTASSPGPEPRAVPSPLRSEPHATCDATNRHVPCRLNGALPQPPAHPWHVSRVEMPVAARATARPSRLVKFGIHRPTRAHRRTIPRFQCLSLKRGYYDIISQPQRAPFWPFQRMLQMRFLRMRSPVSVSRTWVVQCHAHRRRDPCNPLSLAWRCFKLARHSHTNGMAPRRHGQVFAAVYRSCAYQTVPYMFTRNSSLPAVYGCDFNWTKLAGSGCALSRCQFQDFVEKNRGLKCWAFILVQCRMTGVSTTQRQRPKLLACDCGVTRVMSRAFRGHFGGLHICLYLQV